MSEQLRTELIASSVVGLVLGALLFVISKCVGWIWDVLTNTDGHLSLSPWAWLSICFLIALLFWRLNSDVLRHWKENRRGKHGKRRLE